MKSLPKHHPSIPSLSNLNSQLSYLNHDDSPLWGIMNANEMILHNIKFIHLYLGKIIPSLTIRVLARCLGPFFLRRIIQTEPKSSPRNLKTLPQVRSEMSDLDEKNFNQHKTQLHDLISQVDSMIENDRENGNPIYFNHVLYGNMSVLDMKGILAHHLTHHFIQFKIQK